MEITEAELTPQFKDINEVTEWTLEQLNLTHPKKVNFGKSKYTKALDDLRSGNWTRAQKIIDDEYKKNRQLLAQNKSNETYPYVIETTYYGILSSLLIPKPQNEANAFTLYTATYAIDTAGWSNEQYLNELSQDAPLVFNYA